MTKMTGVLENLIVAPDGAEFVSVLCVLCVVLCVVCVGVLLKLFG